MICFSASQEKKTVISVDKESEIDKRRKELAKQKELREKLTKDDVCFFIKNLIINKEFLFYRQKT